MTEPAPAGSCQEGGQFFLHLTAERQAVVGGGTVGHHQVVPSPGHQLRVGGVGVREEPGVVPHQADPGLQEDDEPGVVVLLCGLDGDVDLLQSAGLAGTQVLSPPCLLPLTRCSRLESETGNIRVKFSLSLRI